MTEMSDFDKAFEEVKADFGMEEGKVDRWLKMPFIDFGPRFKKQN